MGRQLSYKIVKKGYIVPKEEDFENIRDYDKEYDKYLDGFEQIDGSKNSWEGPCGYDRNNDNDILYTRDDIIKHLREYINCCDYLNNHYDNNMCADLDFRFTLKAFGEIISSMDGDDSCVIIHYL